MKLQKKDHKYEKKKIVGLSLLTIGCCSATYTISDSLMHILQLQGRPIIGSCITVTMLMLESIYNRKIHKPSIDEQPEMDSPSPLQKKMD